MSEQGPLSTGRNRILPIIVFVFAAFLCKSWITAVVTRSFNVWKIPQYHGYLASYYFLDYSHGFVPRALIGSIFNQLCPGTISVNRFFLLAFFGLAIVLSIGVGAALYTIFKETQKEKRLWLILLLLYAYFNPGTYLFFGFEFGRMDMYIIGLVVLYGSLRLLSPKFIFLLPLFAALCVAIHEAAMFLYVPVLLLISFLPGKDISSRQIRNVLIFSAATVVACAAVIFAGKMNFANETYCQIIQNNIVRNGENPWIEISVHDVEIYSNFTYLEHIEKFFSGKGFPPYVYIRMLLTILFFLFAYAFFWKIWHKLWIGASGKREKIKWAAALLLSLCPLLMCLIGCDYGRWFAAFTYAQYIVLFILISQYDGRFRLERSDILFCLAGIILFNAVGNAQTIAANDLIDIISLNLQATPGFPQ